MNVKLINFEMLQAKRKQIPLNRRTFITMPGSNIIFVTIVKAPRKATGGDIDDMVFDEHVLSSSSSYVPKMYSWSIYNDSSYAEWYCK